MAAKTRHKNGRLKFNIVRYHQNFICGYWFPTLKISTIHHFQNGRHNTANIQHCPISSKFDMWVDNDVPNWWKWQTSRKFWKRRIAPLMVTYHYVKFYVSIIIYLEVININVRNFNFPIGFYSNPHPLWTPQNMTLTPFTTKLKTLGPTRNIQHAQRALARNHLGRCFLRLLNR
jgi:hypothetical protein